MYVLIVFFWTTTAGGCSDGRCVGVAMQEFSSVATCEEAKAYVLHQSKQLTAECKKK